MSGVVVVVEGLVGGVGGGVLALCLWTRVELNLEERERERCHLSVKRLANKSWQSRGGRGGRRENMEVNESKGDKAEERWGQFFILSLFRLFLLTSFLRPGSVCLFRTPLQFFVCAVEVLLPKAGDFCPAGELRARSASPVSTSLRLLARELWIGASLVRIPAGCSSSSSRRRPPL